MRSLAFAFILATVATVSGRSTSLLRGVDQEQKERKLEGPCGTISAETLAAMGLTAADCALMVGETKSDPLCVEYRNGCPFVCGVDEDCILVPSYNVFECGTLLSVSITYGVEESSLRVVCDDLVALESP